MLPSSAAAETVMDPRVIADQRCADRDQPGRHRQVVAADPVDDALIAGGGVGVADRGVDLGAQRVSTVGEIAAQYGKTEGAEVIGRTRA